MYIEYYDFFNIFLEDNEQNVDDLLIELLAIEENNRGFHVPQDIESSFSYPSSSNANGG